jgi:hypothetical protein
MSDAVTLLGNLTAGPQSVCEGGFPSGLLQINFGLAGSCPGAGTKAAAKKFYSSVNVNAASFTTLEGVGTNVQQANVLYLRTTSLLKFRLTYADPAGGADIVSIVPVLGLLIQEPPDSGYLKLLEVLGSGNVEYFASGNQ